MSEEFFGVKPEVPLDVEKALNDALDLIEREGMLDRWRDNYKYKKDCTCEDCEAVRLFIRCGRSPERAKG